MFTKQKKSGVDMTDGSLAPNIIRYVLPLAFTGILQQLFNAADLAVVGQFVGKEAMAAVGSNSAVIGLIINLFVGISLGANIVIAQASGQDDDEKIEKAVHSALLVALIAGILMIILGESIAKPIVSLLGVPDDVYSMALLYLRIYLVGMPVILLYNFESAIFRSRGYSQIPLYALMVSGLINVVLNLFFVLGCGMKVEGVALATVISNLISSLILFVCLLRTKDKIHVSLKKIKLDWKVLSIILRIGIPAGVQGMVFSLSNIIVQSAINSLGSTIMAASSAAFNLEIISYYVMNAYGQACSTFTGQNYGAKNGERCRKVMCYCLVLDAISTATVFSLILFFGRTLLSLFNSDTAVIDAGMIRLKFIAFAYVFSFIQEVLSGYLRGFGISQITAICAIFGICGTRILWILFVFPMAPSFAKIMQVYPLSLAITAGIIVMMTLIIQPSKRYIIKGDLS